MKDEVIANQFTVEEKIQMEKYKNTKPFKLDASFVNMYHSDAERRETRAEYGKEEARLMGMFKADLLAEHGVTDNPKADRCFQLAWDHGHASGLSEIVIYFEEFVELIK